jgi:bacterioferritin-associated ferredoxin
VYVCHCQAVTDHVIHDVLQAGAATIEDIALGCGAGTDCGGCWDALEELLERHLARSDSRELVDARR